MEDFLFSVMEIGEHMLISGAEVHRVEESITRMCSAYGISRTDVFIITSSMVVTVYTDDNKSYTQTRRITKSDINYEKLHRLNKLSREICEKKLTTQEIREKTHLAVNCKTYPFWMECICYAVIAGAFALFFGGDIMEAAVSLIIGAVVRFGILFCEKIINNKIFIKFFSSVVTSALAFAAVKFGFIQVVDKVIIGNIMTLIPGIGLTNALRDLFTGDSIAGLLRSIEAVLIALAIAAGYFLVVILGGAAL